MIFPWAQKDLNLPPESVLRALPSLIARCKESDSLLPGAEMFADIKKVFEKKMSSTQEVKCCINSHIRLAKAR